METKPRNGGMTTGNRRRRDRAARMQKRQQRQCAVAEISENEESPPVRQKRPPTRKKRIKEPVYQEDIVDGFAFLCFKTYEDLQRTVNKYEKKVEVDGASTEDNAPRQINTNDADHPPVLEESLPHLEKKPKKKTNNTLPKVKKKNYSRNNLKDSCLTNDENSKPGEEILETPRSTSRDQLSDASSHASLERGYMCDSESGDERGSEPECDLFSSKVTDSHFIAKKNNPGHSQNCRSPPVLPPIHPVHNGTHHPEPSTAVAAVTASASPANTSSTMVVGSTSPREPQIGSPAVIPVSCSSPASPPSGVVPASPPPFLHKGPPPPVNAKDSASSSKLLSNGYEFVSDTSPPSPLAAAKLLSPSKFLHKRAPPVPSCRDSVATLSSKPAINVYDFVSDHSAPSSPDGVIFISQSKFHHKGISPPVAATANKDPPSVDKVSNGHAANMCVSPPPILASPVIQNSHNKSALDMSIKANVSVCKTEQQQPPTILPPSASGDLRLQASPGQSRSSYSIPYSTSQPIRKMTSSPRMSPLTIPTSMSSPAHSVPSVLPVSPAAVISMRTTTASTSVTMSSVSQALSTRCRSPVVTASHSNTPTPIPARDTHSSHSNSSLSSLSQLSTPVHKERDGGGSRSHSNSSNTAPSVSAALTSASAYASASSLAGLVFSKPQCWSGNSTTTNTISVSTTRSSPAPPRASPALSSSGSTSLPLPPTLPPAHHTSPFGNHAGPPPPPLLPVASHHTIFTTGSLTPTLPLEATAGPSPYRAEALFPQPGEYKKHPDFLRRELDTRFLASQDHSIPIPPPPYMQSEVQHHSQMHQQGPFMAPPPLGAPMVSQQASHLYEKYPKLDSSLYRRPSIGLSNYPPVSSLFAPGGGASTPFVPPAHLAALQPKINSVSKNKSMKPGKWCAMHVRIAWEIYNHQQKQKQAEAHKAGIALASVKPPDHMHAANHLFCSLPRTHEMSPFSSSLLSAAASGHPRSFEPSSHHSTFLNPTPAHLGPFARPGYSTFAGAAPGFSSLGPLGLPGPSMLGADLRTSCLPGQDPWAQRTSLPFGSGSPWGGLKEEAERDRLQQERKREEERQKRAEQEKREREERERREQERREQERREQERREQERRELERQEQERKEQERKEKERREQERRREMERRELERREQERQKERDREIRLHHQLQKSSIVMNGDIRDHHLHHPQHQHHHPHHHAVAREWERARDSRDLPRSPIVPPNNPVKYEGALERHVYPPPPPRLDIKIKQERKDDEPVPVSRSSRSGVPGDDRIRKRPGSIPDGADPVSLVSRSVVHNSVPLGLNSLDHSRLMGPHGLVPSPAKDHHSQTSPLWGPLTPSPTVTTIPGATMDHYRIASRAEHEMRRFDSLVMSPRDSANSELSRQISNVLDLERAVAYDRAKLLPPPLRTNESPYATPPTLPPASASSFFSPPVSPFLNSLCGTSSRTKPGPAGMLNGLPPPLIPCTFPVQNHTGFPTARTSSPMTTHKLLPGGPVLNLQDPYFTKDRREVNGHPSDFDAHLRL